jgi:hypothetical protein
MGMVVDNNEAVAEIAACDPPLGSASIDRPFTVLSFDCLLN